MLKHNLKRIMKIVVSAVDRGADFEFMDLGVTTIRREIFGTALTLGQDALQLLGFDPYEALVILGDPYKILIVTISLKPLGH